MDQKQNNSIHYSPIEKIMNRMVNFLTSKGYKEGLDYIFESSEFMAYRARLIVPNIKKVDPHELGAAFIFAAETENFDVSDPKPMGPVTRAYIDITAYHPQ